MLRTLGGTMTVQPGDFAAVRMESTVGNLIHVGQILNGSGFRDYEHAIFYVGGPQDLILEAEPGGAKLQPYHYDDSGVLWSTTNSKLDLNVKQRMQVGAVATRYEGVPYSFLDYAAIAAHTLQEDLHLPQSQALKRYIANTGHQICSQLVDQCRLDLGCHLFNDGRWPGYVTPVDLANLIKG